MAGRLLRRFSSSKKSEGELDFRPSSARRPSELETTDFDTLAKAEIDRLTKGGGGAVVGDVEWVPDPLTGGQRAVLRPVSAKVIEERVLNKGATEAQEESKEDIHVAASGSDVSKGEAAPMSPPPNIPPRSPPRSPPRPIVSPPSPPTRDKDLPQPAGQTRKKKGKDGGNPMSNMTAAEKAEYAKRTIEAAIEAERQALEKKLAIKKRSPAGTQ